MLPTAGVPFLAHLLSRIRAAGVRPRRARHLLPRRDVREPLRRRLRARPRAALRGRGATRSAPAAGSATSPTHLSAETRSWSSTATCSPGIDLRARRRHPPARRAPTSRCTWSRVRRPARLRLRAHRRRRPGPARSSRRPRTRRPTRSTPAATSSAARSSTRSRRAGRCRSSARRSPGCSPRAPGSQAHVDAAYWLDLGTPADLVRGSADLVRGRGAVGRPARPDRGGAGARRARTSPRTPS